MKEGDSVKARCNLCAGERNHVVIHFHRKEWTEEIAEDSRIYGEDRYELLRCGGCESITLRHTSLFSEHTDDDGRMLPTVTYYPPQTFRHPPKWLNGVTLPDEEFVSIVWLPAFVGRLMREVYTALHSNCLSLAAMGVRALLETVMIDRVGDRGSFKKNLEAFEVDGHISSKQKEIVDATLEAGHASIHRGYSPSREVITLVLDMTEVIIEAIYVSGEQAAALRKKIPQRAKAAKPNTP